MKDNDAISFLKSGLPRRERAASLREDITDKVPVLLDQFYKALLSSSAKDMISGDINISKLRSSQAKHWQGLFEDSISSETEEKSRRIGRVHQNIGLPSAWYIASYGWIMMQMIPIITKQHRFRPQELDEVICTLISRMFHDMTVSVSSYETEACNKAIEEQKAINTQNLGRIADLLANINKVILQLAFLLNHTVEVAHKSQTISSASTELVSSVEEISRNSESASTEADHSSEAVNNGKNKIDQVSNTITKISNTVDETSQNVNNLSESSDQIGQILSVIEGIADQTNLLALNATIEATRAGEAGKGFSVVASEVKNLANQTSRATEDISALIISLREGMANIQQNMDASTSAVSNGQHAIQQTLEQMTLMTKQVGGVSDRMREMSTILNQQKQASLEIASSISSIAESSGESESFVTIVSEIMHNCVASFSKNAAEMYIEDSDLALCYMTKIDHVMFKQRVIDTCMGKDSWKSSEVPDHHSCRLGKWYDSLENQEIKNSEAYKALVEPHKKVHQSAKTALNAHYSKDIEGMETALRQLDGASIQVLKILDEIATNIQDAA